MIMCMYKGNLKGNIITDGYRDYPPGINVICITNRHLAGRDYFEQVERVAGSHPHAVILREKDLPEPAYEALAFRVMGICSRYHVPCILHTYVHAAARLGATAIHLPLPALLLMPEKEKAYFHTIGASTHSVQEALAAQKAGASYITASHIYATDCKKGLPPKGILFLREICQSVAIPVYALGGIHAENAEGCVQAGAAGVCIMSECMQ